MANNDAAVGLKPVRRLSGQPYCGGGFECYANDTSSALAIGVPVTLTGTANASGVPEVKRAIPGTSPIFGVITGINGFTAANVLTRDSASYIAANTVAFVNVETDPDVLYEVQEDSVGGALAATSTGLNANLVLAAVNTTTGIIPVQIDSNTASDDVSTSIKLDVQILAVSQRSDNEIGTNAKWLVRLNHTQDRAGRAPLTAAI